MGLFDPRNKEISPRAAKLYVAFGIAHAIADFTAAGLFIIGSALFFREQTVMAGTWCFLAGSIFFALKPTLRLIRELRLASLHRLDSIVAAAPEGPDSVKVVKPGDDAQQ